MSSTQASVGSNSASVTSSQLTQPPGNQYHSPQQVCATPSSSAISTLNQSKYANIAAPSPQPQHHIYHHLHPKRPFRWVQRKWRSFFCKEKEVPKVVIYKGFFHCFGHISVHLLPSVVTAVVLGLNLRLYQYAKVRGHYIGAWIMSDELEDETVLNWLQFAAKLHEITIVASLSTIIWDMVRYFFVYKPLGVPLGLVGASSDFTEVKFLVSKELHAIWRMQYGTVAKITVFVTVSLFCIMANLVGPSSAILLIPRNHTWPVAEYKFVINGTRNKDLWPQILTKDHIGGPDCSTTNNPNTFDNPSCIAGAYHPIAQYFRSFISYPSDGSFEFNAIDGRTSRTLHGNTRNGMTHYSETWTMAPHAASVVVHEEIRTIWSKRLNDVPGLNYRDAFLRTAMVNTTGPVVRTACVPARNLSTSTFEDPSRGGIEVFPMEFPMLEEETFWVPESVNGFGSGPTGRINLPASLLLLNLPGEGDSSNRNNRTLVVKTTWLPSSSLPESFHNTSTSAALLILMSASDPESGVPHPQRFNLGISCAVDLRWAPSANIVASSQSDWARAGYRYPTKTSALHRRGRPNDRAGRIYREQLFLPGRSDPEKKGWTRVTGIEEEWLSALTPGIPDRNGGNNTSTTTLEAILEDTIPNLWAVAEHPSVRDQVELYHDPGRYELLVLAEHVTATMVADGAARLGLGLQGMMWELERPLVDAGLPDVDGPEGRRGNDLFSLGGVELPRLYTAGNDGNGNGTELVMNTVVHGYGLRLDGRSGILAAVVLCLHLLVVLVHVVCLACLFGNETMVTWKSSTELLLLGLSSAGSKEFANDDETREMLSCGGVGAERATTFTRLVRVEALTGGNHKNVNVQEVRLRLGKGKGGGEERLKHGKVCVVSGVDT